MKRRELLRALGTLPLVACSRQETGNTTLETRREPSTPSARMPVIFAAHGAPVLLDDAGWVGELAAWAAAMPRPGSVLVVSAHWEQRPATLGATRTVPLIYDFHGFPQRYYQTRYPAPGAANLAGRVRELMRAKGIALADDAERGLDHGAYVPLAAMYPAADVPVLQLSLPGLDAWAESAISRFDVDALIDFQTRAPAARLALPTWEHYAPLLVSVGATAASRNSTTFPITGFWNDQAFTRRSVQFT